MSHAGHHAMMNHSMMNHSMMDHSHHMPMDHMSSTEHSIHSPPMGIIGNTYTIYSIF